MVTWTTEFRLSKRALRTPSFCLSQRSRFEPVVRFYSGTEALLQAASFLFYLALFFTLQGRQTIWRLDDDDDSFTPVTYCTDLSSQLLALLPTCRLAVFFIKLHLVFTKARVPAFLLSA